MRTILACILAASASATQLFHRQTYDTHDYYVLHHDPVHASLADVAEFFGLDIVEPVGELEDMWLARREVPRYMLHSRSQGASLEEDDPVINSYEEMWDRSLLKRRGDNLSFAVRHLSRQIPRQHSKSAPPTRHTWRSKDRTRTIAKRRLNISDPLFPKQWSLENKEDSSNSHHVIPVWEAGYTGKGIIVSLIDDGLMNDHEDIKDNFAKAQSYDFIRNEFLSVLGPDDSHGTAAAGVIAAAKNNLCGVGIAYNAKIASLRVNGPNRVLPVHEAMAFHYALNHVSIYNIGYSMVANSLDVLAYVAELSMLKGINEGRGRRGNIYVTAAGNDGAGGDDCNYSEYVSSIYTITIGSATNKGEYARYSTPCSAVMAVAYSDDDDDLDMASDDSDDSNAYHHQIVTLGIGSSRQECDEKFGGTSAAAPTASAIFALALEANNNLTWRDLQHLCVETARPVQGAKSREHSNEVGFGILDAEALVKAAIGWKPVNQQVWMTPQYIQFEGGRYANGKFGGGTKLSKQGVLRTVKITGDMIKEHNFDKIEHVQVKVWIQHSRRGDVEVSLASPNKKVSQLGKMRKEDSASTGFHGWTFMSLKHWGDSPEGEWTVKVNDQSGTPGAGTGKIIGLTVSFWGTIGG